MSDEREREERRIGARPAVAHEVPSPSVSSVDLRAKGSRLWMVLIIVAALAAAAAAAIFAFGGKKQSEENARKAGMAAGDGHESADGTRGMEEAQALIIQGLLEDLARKPCDRNLALRAATELTERHEFKQVVRITADFVKNCPGEPFVRLLRKGYYANEQLEQWPQAAEVASMLIIAQPDEGSFWWWRGQARVKANQLDQAAADLRQAMAATPFEDSRGYSLMDFADIADKVGAPCDAAAGLRLYQELNPRGVAQRVRDLQARLHLAGNCDAAYGTGQTAITIDQTQPVPVTQASVGKASGKFLIAPRTGYTLLSRAFADKAGVEANGPPVDSYAGGALHTGMPAVADKVAVGKAAATGVHVLVVDQLPGGLDGVLGMSFMGRFSFAEFGDQITLDAWAPGQ